MDNAPDDKITDSKKSPQNLRILGILIVIVIIVGAGYYLLKYNKNLTKNTSTQPQNQVVNNVNPTATSTTDLTNNIYMTKTNSTKGTYLSDFQGMTLYVFDKDTSGVSNCYSTCAVTWPSYSSGATAQVHFPANITTIKRTDGSLQFAWKNMPLYYYHGDQKPGDTLGDGIGGIWHIVKP